jgi:cation transporter-like permease
MTIKRKRELLIVTLIGLAAGEIIHRFSPQMSHAGLLIIGVIFTPVTFILATICAIAGATLNECEREFEKWGWIRWSSIVIGPLFAFLLCGLP